jgi:site-specific recombinase XerD
VCFLETKGMAAHTPPPLITPAGNWLDRFDAHLAGFVGAAASTRKTYRTTVARFLDARFATGEPAWSRLSADDLTAFVQREAERRQGFGRRAAPVALRAFLRFLVSLGLVSDALAPAIPIPRQWKHAFLPQHATPEQIAAVLKECDDGTAVGLRDRAVLLLLSRLGLRAKEVGCLSLDDIDWNDGRLVIRMGKSRRERILPIPEEVGSALASYLKRGRPPTRERKVFLDAQPPHRPWRGASAVSQLARRRLRRSGFPDGRWLGAHLFRHTIASAMVNTGASYKEVADVLGHKSLETTGIYAKLNLETLAAVALPWTGGAQ